MCRRLSSKEGADAATSHGGDEHFNPLRTGQIQVPNRPLASLFQGEQGKQRSSIAAATRLSIKRQATRCPGQFTSFSTRSAARTGSRFGSTVTGLNRWRTFRVGTKLWKGRSRLCGAGVLRDKPLRCPHCRAAADEIRLRAQRVAADFIGRRYLQQSQLRGSLECGPRVRHADLRAQHRPDPAQGHWNRADHELQGIATGSGGRLQRKPN